MSRTLRPQRITFWLPWLCVHLWYDMIYLVFNTNTSRDDRAANWRSRSFKVIHFCCNRKPTYDFLLVNNCHLRSISHRFRDTGWWTLEWCARNTEYQIWAAWRHSEQTGDAGFPDQGRMQTIQRAVAVIKVWQNLCNKSFLGRPLYKDSYWICTLCIVHAVKFYTTLSSTAVCQFC